MTHEGLEQYPWKIWHLTQTPPEPVFFYTDKRISHVTIFEGATLNDVRRLQNMIAAYAAHLEKQLQEPRTT